MAENKFVTTVNASFMNAYPKNGFLYINDYLEQGLDLDDILVFDRVVVGSIWFGNVKNLVSVLGDHLNKKDSYETSSIMRGIMIGSLNYIMDVDDRCTNHAFLTSGQYLDNVKYMMKYADMTQLYLFKDEYMNIPEIYDTILKIRQDRIIELSKKESIWVRFKKWVTDEDDRDKASLRFNKNMVELMIKGKAILEATDSDIEMVTY